MISSIFILYSRTIDYSPFYLSLWIEVVAGRESAAAENNLAECLPLLSRLVSFKLRQFLCCAGFCSLGIQRHTRIKIQHRKWKVDIMGLYESNARYWWSPDSQNTMHVAQERHKDYSKNNKQKSKHNSVQQCFHHKNGRPNHSVCIH